MTYRSLSRYSPNFDPDDKGKVESGMSPPAWEPTRLDLIKFRHVTLYLLGSMVMGCFVGIIAGALAELFTHSKFVVVSVFGISIYATLVIGYQWTAQDYDWVTLRTRFTPVGRKPLVLGALGAIGLIAFISLLHGYCKGRV